MTRPLALTRTLVLTFALAASLPAHTAPDAKKDDASLNFINADVESVIRAIGPLTGKTFVIDPKVQGTLTVISGAPVDRRLIYPILLSALRSQGFAAIETGKLVRIVPEPEAKHQFSPAFDAANMSGDRVATAVFKLKNQSATQIMQAIRPLVGPNQGVTAFAGTNAIVITDMAENLKRIQSIIDALDVPGRGEPAILAVRHGNAAEIAATANRVLSGEPRGDSPAATLIIAEPRNNTVLIKSESAAAQERALALVRQLDEAQRSEGGIQVVRLKNADAVKLAQTLKGMLSGAPATPATSGTTGTSATPASEPVGSTTIQADVATNSLVISAPPPVFRTLREVIDKLDSRRAQVFVEALIAEVSTDRTREFGIQWQDISGAAKTDSRVIGGTNLGARGSGNNIIDTAANISTLGRGLNIGVVKGTVTLPGIGEVLNLGLLARALETEARANILSTPNLLTLDNEEARIVVGQNVPILTGQFTQTAGNGATNPFQTFERRDVGISLRVRPQISESGAIRLFISQEVSSVAQDASTSGIVFNKRSIDSTVLVDDGKIVVLGGLLKDDMGNAEDRVPILGSTPFIGWLFSYEKKTRVKTNLMVFLRPRVLRDDAASSAITQTHLDQIRDAQQAPEAQPGPVLP